MDRIYQKLVSCAKVAERPLTAKFRVPLFGFSALYVLYNIEIKAQNGRSFSFEIEKFFVASGKFLVASGEFLVVVGVRAGLSRKFSDTPVIRNIKVLRPIHKIPVSRRNRQTLWGGCTDANPKLLLNDT